MDKNQTYDNAMNELSNMINKLKDKIDLKEIALTNKEKEILNTIPSKYIKLIDAELAKYKTDGTYDTRKQFIYKALAILFSNLDFIKKSIDYGYNIGSKIYA